MENSVYKQWFIKTVDYVWLNRKKFKCHNDYRGYALEKIPFSLRFSDSFEFTLQDALYNLEKGRIRSKRGLVRELLTDPDWDILEALKESVLTQSFKV